MRILTRPEAPRRRRLCAALALAALALVELGGCASAPLLPPVAGGQPLRIVVKVGAPAGGPVDVRNLALGEGATAGVGTGLVAGGLWGLTCGPLAVLCVPLGAAAGVLTGGAAGVAVGATGVLPAEKVARLRERVARGQPVPSLADALRREVVERAQGRWRLVDDPAAATLLLEVQTVEFGSTRDERLGLVLRVQAGVSPAGSAVPPVMRPRPYEYSGPLAPLSIWLDEDSDFLATSFGNAMRQIAAQVVGEMALH